MKNIEDVLCTSDLHDVEEVFGKITGWKMDGDHRQSVPIESKDNNFTILTRSKSPRNPKVYRGSAGVISYKNSMYGVTAAHK